MTVLEILALIAAIIGIAGSIVPGLPGPPISWVGLLLLTFAGLDEATPKLILIWLGITVAVTVLDYLIPVWTTRATGGHKEASTGALLGMIIGLLVPPVGMIAGAFIGAVIGEYKTSDEGFPAALKAGFGAFLGFMLGTGLKFLCSGLMLYYILKIIF